MDRKAITLFLVGVAIYGANIWGPSVYVLDEAKNAGCAMEMHTNEDWIVPLFNGELRVDKPPLHYFFMRVGFSWFGVNPFAARWGSLLMGLGLILSVYFFTRRLIGSKAAFLSSLFLSVSIQLSMQFHLAVPDPYLILFLFLGLFSFYKGYHLQQATYMYGFYAFIGIATLAKGPVACILSTFIVLGWMALQKTFSWQGIRMLKIPAGIFIFLGIVLPWYVLVSIKTDGEWIQRFFWEHNMGRFTQTMEGHKGFPLASVVIVIVALLPFSLFAPQAVFKAWQRRNCQPLLLFCLLCLGVIVTFFAFSQTILPNYPEPALPFLGILLGVYFANDSGFSRANRWSGGVYAMLMLVLPVSVIILLGRDPVLGSYSWLGWLCIPLSLGGIIGFIYLILEENKKAIYTYVISVMLFLLSFFYYIHPYIDRLNPVVQGMDLMKADQQAIAYKDFNPAFVFARKEILKVYHHPQEIAELQFPHYLITQERYLPELEDFDYQMVFKGKDLFENGVTVVLQVE